MSSSRVSNGDELEGFQELSDLLSEISKEISDENVKEALSVGAQEFVNILLKLPKPISRIRSPGYTHMVDTFALKEKGKQVEVGWGKYYGPMQENGWLSNRGNPHMIPTWNRNKEKIYRSMIERTGLGKG